MTSPAAASVTPLDMDEIDLRIIAVLREDGRMPYRSIARELGLTEATVRTRVKRLEDTDTMRVVAVTDTQAAGYDMLLAVGVQVEGRSPEAVAEDLARIPEVFSVNVAVGNHDVEVLVMAPGPASLSTLLAQTLGGIAGVRRLTPALAVDVLKNQPDWVPFYDA